MAAKDLFHQIVKDCLETDGWIVTHDGYRLATELLKDAVSIDFGAEKLITAERASEKIAVEVKSFLGDSLIYDFHVLLGKYLFIR